MLFDIALVAATLGCALVSGFLLGFAVVAMPGISTLDDREFLRAFQVMDRVIQDRHPLFMLMWVGSVLAVVAALVLGIGELTGSQLLLLVLGVAVYLLGVQLPTAVVNIPLNNRVQGLDVPASSGRTAGEARGWFESRWNRWNAVRTAFGVLATVLLLVVLLGR